MRSIGRQLGHGIDIAFGLAALAAVIALAVGAIAFGRGAVQVVEGWFDGHAHGTDAPHLRGAATTRASKAPDAAQAAMRSMALRRLAASRAATLYDSASVG